MEAGASARGALARCRRDGRTGDSVSLLRKLPWDQASIEIKTPDASCASAGVPTHLLFGSTAWRIDENSLLLGSQTGQTSRHIELPGEMPGVSRQHCEIRRENGQCLVEDRSRYGTFLNGHRVNGSTVLQVGDSLRVGTPGYEFLLITTDENHGA